MLFPVSASLTDPGRKRGHNEDAFFADDALGFYVVADGVGGRAKGEVASEEAIEQLHLWIKRSKEQLDTLFDADMAGDQEACWKIRGLLESGVKSACYMVHGMAAQDPDRRGMATTMSTLLIGPGACYSAHVGDSRVYRIRGNEVLQITEDHTLINYKLRHGHMTPEEAKVAEGHNVITRAVGHKDHVQVDTTNLSAIAKDRFLLCSDGLHGYFNDDSEIADLIAEGDLKACVHASIALANNRGGKDNITAIAVELRED